MSEGGAEGVRLALGELLAAERRLRGRDSAGGEKLSYAQGRALFELGRCGELTAGQIARHAALSPATVTAMLDGLERQGIVARRRDAPDRRVVTVSLTDEGRALLDAKLARWRGLWDEALADAAPEELDAAERVLRRMAGVLDAL